MDQETPIQGTPDAKELLRDKRAEGGKRLLGLYIQRRRLAKTLAQLDANIAQHENELDMLDAVLGLL